MSHYEEDYEGLYDELSKPFEDGHEFDLTFADPDGRSALRAAGRKNPRNLPCPTCLKPNRLTPKDRQLGYQCDECADRAEGLLPDANY